MHIVRASLTRAQASARRGEGVKTDWISGSDSLRLRWAVYLCHIQCSTEWQRRFLVQLDSTCCLRHHLRTSPYRFPCCLSDTYTTADGSDVLRSRTAVAIWRTNTIYL